jgi:hypothetical protein
MVKRKLDPMRIVEIANKRYLYRCEACGAESPAVPVPFDQLGLAPPHHCAGANDDIEVGAIIEPQDKAGKP